MSLARGRFPASGFWISAGLLRDDAAQRSGAPLRVSVRQRAGLALLVSCLILTRGVALSISSRQRAGTPFSHLPRSPNRNRQLQFEPWSRQNQQSCPRWRPLSANHWPHSDGQHPPSEAPPNRSLIFAEPPSVEGTEGPQMADGAPAVAAVPVGACVDVPGASPGNCSGD